MEVSFSLCGLAFSCKKDFALLKTALTSPECRYLDQISLTFVEDEAHRFFLWGTNIGAFQDAWIQSSLDYRLRDASQIRRQVSSVLKRLLDNLKSGELLLIPRPNLPKLT